MATTLSSLARLRVQEHQAALCAVQYYSGTGYINISHFLFTVFPGPPNNIPTRCSLLTFLAGRTAAGAGSLPPPRLLPPPPPAGLGPVEAGVCLHHSLRGLGLEEGGELAGQVGGSQGRVQWR